MTLLSKIHKYYIKLSLIQNIVVHIDSGKLN